MIDPHLIDRVTTAYAAQFGTAPTQLFHAPGRVNIIGEHTDYNDGFVLPCAINYGTVIALGTQPENWIDVLAVDYDGTDRFQTTAPAPDDACADWTHHVRGIASVMAGKGVTLGGTRLAIGGNVPQGAGLSSSASLGVALAMALAARAQRDDLSLTDLALIAQKSENDCVGTACGIMDQLVSARAKAAHGLLIDCRTLEVRPAPLPAAFSIMIVHSGVKRELVESAYNARRAQCEAVARHFGVSALRDIDMAMLTRDVDVLDPLAFRRARHVVTENARTLAAADALSCGDMELLGQLMVDSHLSMRDDFEITVPPVDALVSLLQTEIGPVGGARMTGGGFGGCVVAILPDADVGRVKGAVLANYTTPDGKPPLIIDAIASDGAQRLA